MSELIDAYKCAHTVLTRYLIPPLVDIVLNKYYLHTYNLADVLPEFSYPLKVHLYECDLETLFSFGRSHNVPIHKLHNWHSKIDTIYYWSVQDSFWNKDDRNWCLIGSCTNNIYFVYESYCFKRGFDIAGMVLSAANNMWELMRYCTNYRYEIVNVSAINTA